MNQLTSYPSLHILIYGEPFSGKSTFNMTMPTPHLVLFFDPWGKDSPYLSAGTVQEKDNEGNPLLNAVGCPMKRVWRGQELLFQLEYFHETVWTANVRSGIAPVPIAYEKFTERLITIDSELDYWQTISVDSLTYMTICIKTREKYKINPGEKYDLRHWAGGARSLIEEVVMLRLGGLPCNVVLVAHEKIYVNEVTNQVMREVDSVGTLGRNLTVGFGEFYRMINDPTKGRYLQTAKDNLWTANSKYAPNPCEPLYSAIMQHYKPQQ